LTRLISNAKLQIADGDGNSEALSICRRQLSVAFASEPRQGHSRLTAVAVGASGSGNNIFIVTEARLQKIIHRAD